jgi:glucan phosphoethanolaminetransferase (alkaline phosphatase superfamily)
MIKWVRHYGKRASFLRDVASTFARRASVAARAKPRRRLVALATVVEALALFLLAWQPIFEARLDPRAIGPEQEQGPIYLVDLNGVARSGYRIAHEAEPSALAGLVSLVGLLHKPTESGSSSCVLLQDGRPLGPDSSLHLRAHVGGAFTRWGDRLYFLTPANTDPRIDGHTYSVRARFTLDSSTRTALLSVLVVLGGAILWSARAWLQSQIGPIKVTALIVMIMMAPWAWSNPIIWMFDFLSTSPNNVLLYSYLTLVAAAFASLAVAPFLSGTRIRVAAALILLGGFAVDRSVFALSGEHSTIELMRTLLREYREAPAVYSTFGSTIAVNCIFAFVISSVFMLRPPARWTVSSRYSLLIIGTLIGSGCLTRISSYSAYAIPSPFSVPAQLAISLFHTSDEGGERRPVLYEQPLKPVFKKIIMVVDESVRGDYFGLNNSAYDNTPYLRSNKIIINFGTAVSTSNCSAPSRLLMRLGLQRRQLPDTKGIWRETPTIWQFAHKAGFKTVLIDGFRPFGSYHSYMNEIEARAIDTLIPQAISPEYTRDVAVADTLLDALKNDEPMFIYVNKYGVHFPYDTKYPPDMSYDPSPLVAKIPVDSEKRRIIGDYHRAVLWSVDTFFRKVLPAAVNSDTLLIYTSDHGQALFEGGYEFQHCTFNSKVHPGEAVVPIFAVATSGPFATRLRQQAERGFNRASHFELFPTLLAAMGYAEDWILSNYGPSLLNVPLQRSRELLIGDFFDPSAYWVDIDERMRQHQMVGPVAAPPTPFSASSDAVNVSPAHVDQSYR